MSGEELERLIDSLNESNPDFSKSLRQGVGPSRELTGEAAEIVAVGKRSLDWIKMINTYRGTPFQLWRRQDLRNFPIDKPAQYNGQTVVASYLKVKAEIPQVLGSVLWAKGPFPTEMPVTDDVFREWAQAVDRVYQMQLRWELLQPYLDYLTQERYRDIRGYHFLKIEPSLEQKLKEFKSLSQSDQARLGQWLLNLCEKYLASNRCQSELSDATSRAKVNDFYLKYLERNSQIYDQFFSINVRNSDVRMRNRQLVIPLMDSQDPRHFPFFKINIEDEWTFEGIFSSVVQRANGSGINVDWQPGVTPHVPGLGSSQIVMDSNASLDDWDVQWTIRHEFGHVLGFGDCYVEFYEPENGLITNYQIDTTNLMCARTGKLQEHHARDLIRVYEQ